MRKTESAQLNLFSGKPEEAQVVNVASVPQRSPFRYPGGKTWFVPYFRRWRQRLPEDARTLAEPFAGGGIISLTAAFEELAERVEMCELDEAVAAVWQTILSGKNETLARRILDFDLTQENVAALFAEEPATTEALAFQTVVKNRVLHGGILAKGSGVMKNGENGKGLASRWYPETLARRIRAINEVRHKIIFSRADAIAFIRARAARRDVFFFIDPPYTVAGRRLYALSQIDHEELFRAMSEIQGPFLATYDYTDEVAALADRFRLPWHTIPMKTTHHRTKHELVISNYPAEG